MSKHRKSNDQEIDLLQQRIYLHRLSLRLRAEDLKEAVRERLRAPSSLIGAAAAGFVFERLTRGSRSKSTTQGTPRRDLLSVVPEALHTVLKFAGSGPGLWLVSRLAARATTSKSEAPSDIPTHLPPQPF